MISSVSRNLWGQIARVSGVSVSVAGQANVRPGQSYVIVANHLSHFDIWVLYGYSFAVGGVDSTLSMSRNWLATSTGASVCTTWHWLQK